MSKRIFVIIMMLMVSLPFSACSKVGDAISPDYTPLSQNSQNQDNPAEFSSTIELNPMGEDVDGIFTFGDTTVQGIEVRIDGELADITGEGGEFTVPSIIGNDHTISFSIMGETIHSQPFSPAARFAQDAPDPGPGVMAGSVNDENGPLPGALVVVIKGSVYAFAFTGQYGQYYLAGAPSGNCLAVVLSEFHNTVFQAVNIPSDGTPVEKNFFAPVNLTLGRITGRVMSPGIGAVPGAYVKYEALGVMREDLSNIFGMFDMPAVPVSNGNLEVSRDGFYPSENSFDVHAGLNPAPVFIQVIEQSVVHGVVVNSNNEPVDGAVVRLTIFNKEGELPAVYGMYSGPGGYFLFEDLLPGPFALQAFMPGKVPATSFGTVLPGSN
ncbi:MAG TPA: carboxypeptidase-like regulatory domain-containing protein, partial [bacterium]